MEILLEYYGIAVVFHQVHLEELNQFHNNLGQTELHIPGLDILSMHLIHTEQARRLLGGYNGIFK